MTHYLALDWGEKKIGVALADSEAKIAFAHVIIVNDGQVFDALKELIDEYNVEKIVLGQPQHAAFSQNQKKIEKFSGILQKKMDGEVVSMSEVFSTQSAQENMRAAGKKGGDDAEAARVILQAYLDSGQVDEERVG